MMYGKTGGKGGFVAPGGKGQGGGMVIPPRQGFGSKGAVAVASPSPSPAIANKGSPKGGGKAGSNWGGCGVWNPMFNAMMMLGLVTSLWLARKSPVMPMNTNVCMPTKNDYDSTHIPIGVSCWGLPLCFVNIFESI